MDNAELKTKFEAEKKRLGLTTNQVKAAIKKYNASTFDEHFDALKNYHQFKYPHLYVTCDDCDGEGVEEELVETPIEEAPEQPTVKGRFVGNHPITGKAVYK